MLIFYAAESMTSASEIQSVPAKLSESFVGLQCSLVPKSELQATDLRFLE